MREKVKHLLSGTVPGSSSTSQRQSPQFFRNKEGKYDAINDGCHAQNGQIANGHFDNGNCPTQNGSNQTSAHADNGYIANGHNVQNSIGNGHDVNMQNSTGNGHNVNMQNSNNSGHNIQNAACVGQNENNRQFGSNIGLQHINGDLRLSNESLKHCLRQSNASLGYFGNGEARKRTYSGKDCEYGQDYGSTGNGTCGKTDGGLVWRGAGGGDAEGGPLDTLAASESSQGDKLEGADATQDDPIHLKRRVGLFSGVALIVGTMIGSGIFVSPSGLLVRTGSIGLSFVVWMACGLLSLLGALSYAELGTMNTSSGAEYAYFMDAFGAPPAFLFSWVSTLVLKPSQMAIICLSFAKYAVEAFVSECEPPAMVVKMVAVLAIVLILVVNCYSVNLATFVQNGFTAAKLVAILIVISGGMYKLGQGNTQHLYDKSFSGNEVTLGNVATAFYTGLWAYDGWNNLNYVTEEIKNPSKNLPRSIMIGIPLVTLCYALVNLSYLAVMSAAEMVDSEAVAVTFGNRLLGAMAWLMPLSVTVSTFGSANGTLFAAGRLCFAASREGHLLDILSYVHVRRFTPAPGLIFHSIIAMAMVLYGTIDSLIDFFSFTAWIFYGGSMLALIVMRHTKPHAPRPYKVPIIVPWLVLLISCYLVVAPILEKPQLEYLYASLFIFAGLLFYVPFVKMGYSLPFMGTITVFLQMVLEVVPTTTTFEY